MSKLIITRGLPGSGKTTWAEAFANQAGNTVVVERDFIRKTLFNSYWTGNQQDENKVTKVQNKRVKGLLELGYRVIVSDTNLPDRSVKQWQQVAHDAGVPFEIKEFRDVPLEKVLGRNAQWDRQLTDKVVPEKVIFDKYERFINGRDLTKPVEFTPKVDTSIEPYVQPDWETQFEAVIFDIDNTLAIMGERSPYDGAKVHLDTLNKDVAEALKLYYKAGVHVLIVSGRDEKYREVTEKWLKDTDVLEWDMLLMRPEGDNREDSIIKYELFNKHIRDSKYRILGVFDDRHRVLRMWRKLGLTTFHVNGPDAGNF